MNIPIPDCGCREWLGEDSYDCDKDRARTKEGTCRCKCHPDNRIRLNRKILKDVKVALVSFIGVALWFLVTAVVVFALYIGMVAEPDCQRKGFASVDSKGCWIIKNGERTYENN